MARVGDRIGNYELRAILGGGGFADVFRARHVTLETEHAVKVLHPHHARNERIRARFKREALLQSKHTHPHIVHVTDFVDEPGFAASVMEFIEGHDLGEAIDGDWAGPWGVDDALLVMRPVLEAVALIHGQGVVHRDLKPENILLNQ